MRDRPALVVSTKTLGGDAELLWVLMITSAANQGWPEDISLEHCYASCGLSVPCVIRAAKISTIEAKSAKPLGRVPAAVMELVKAEITACLGS